MKIFSRGDDDDDDDIGINIYEPLGLGFELDVLGLRHSRPGID